MKMIHLFCHGFAVFVAAASIFAQSNETTPPSGKDFKSILIVPAKETKPWSINFVPYGWVTAVDGKITLRGITSDVHDSAIDTLKSLDFAFMAAAGISTLGGEVGLPGCACRRTGLCHYEQLASAGTPASGPRHHPLP